MKRLKMALQTQKNFGLMVKFHMMLHSSDNKVCLRRKEYNTVIGCENCVFDPFSDEKLYNIVMDDIKALNIMLGGNRKGEGGCVRFR